MSLHSEPSSTDRIIIRVLVAEDDEILRELLVRYLKANKLNVVTVGDGALAADLLRRSKFDVVVTDSRMPHMDGMGVMKEVRTLGLKIPIILLGRSGFAATEAVAEV